MLVLLVSSPLRAGTSWSTPRVAMCATTSPCFSVWQTMTSCSQAGATLHSSPLLWLTRTPRNPSTQVGLLCRQPECLWGCLPESQQAVMLSGL